MGRKKGKQRGHYSSKAKKAQHVHELNQHVTDIHQQSRRNYNNKSNHVGGESELTKFRNERSAVSVSILRGIIRERLLEDRERDAVYRRQMMTASVGNSNRNHTSPGRSTNGSNDVKREMQSNSRGMVRNPIGWSLVYNHREAMAGIEQPQNEICKHFIDRHWRHHEVYGKGAHLGARGVHINCNNLQLSCVCALAPFLQQYIDSFGEEYIIERLSSLPSYVITALSIRCENVTDQLIYIMTKLLHVEALVFYGGSGINRSISCKNDVDGYDFIKPGERSNKYVTGAGFYFQNDKEGDELLSSSTTTAIESWEEYLQEGEEEETFIATHMNNTNNTRCMNDKSLLRLELRDIYPKNSNSVISFLQQNPQLTHLCISESFDATSGPEILFCKDMVCHEEEGDSDGITILNYLENLQYLDVSGCTWVNFDLLYLFLRRIIAHLQYSHLSLEIIVLGRCCSYLTQDKIAMLNSSMTEGKPYLCYRAP